MSKIKNGFVVGQHIDAMHLNPLEYLLDENGDVKVFKSKIEATYFLKQHGFTDEDIYWLVIMPVKTCVDDH